MSSEFPEFRRAMIRMGQIFSARSGRIILVIVVGLVIGAIWWNGTPPRPSSLPRPPSTNPTPWITFARKFNEVCLPGHRAELRFSKTTFYVDMRMLSGIRLVDKDPGPICPQGPVKVDWLFFYTTDRWLELKETYLRQGLTFTTLEIDPLRDASQITPVLESAPVTRINLEDGAYIEEITSKAEKAMPLSMRVYKIQHAKGGDGLTPAPIRMACSGLPGKELGRRCRTYYFYPPDLLIGYEFQQDGRSSHLVNFGMPDVVVPEPGDFEKVDARLRQWLEELKQRP